MRSLVSFTEFFRVRMTRLPWQVDFVHRHLIFLSSPTSHGRRISCSQLFGCDARLVDDRSTQLAHLGVDLVHVLL